jgi:hypothetical protein
MTKTEYIIITKDDHGFAVQFPNGHRGNRRLASMASVLSHFGRRGWSLSVFNGDVSVMSRECRSEPWMDFFTEDEADLIRGDRKIAAIRSVRSRTGMNLRDTKEHVERYWYLVTP